MTTNESSAQGDVLLTAFPNHEGSGIREAVKDIVNLKKTLDFITSPTFPTPEYGLDELRELCVSLIEGQRTVDGNLKAGSWSVVPDGPMPSDARVDLVFIPSYIAVAILVWTYYHHPVLLSEFQPTSITHRRTPAPSPPPFERALRLGFRFISYRNLVGHGYDADRDMVKAIGILEKGCVFQFIREYQGFSQSLNNAIEKARERLLELQHKEKEEVDWSWVEPSLLQGALTALSKVAYN